MVDPRSVMTYQPFLPEAAAGSVEPRHVVVPLRKTLKGCRVVTGRVTGIDHANKVAKVMPEEGPEYELAYDQVVVALGSIARTLPIPGLAEEATGFKNVEEAIALRNKVLDRLDVASSQPDPALRKSALTFVFVGGGYAGVEAFAELEDMARYATRYYDNIKPEDMRWVLVEATGRILPEVGEELGKYTVDQLRKRNMDIKLETRLESCEKGHVILSDGDEFDADTIVWTAGVKANPALAGDRLPAGRAAAGSSAWRTCGSRVSTDAWSAGDNAAVPDLTSESRRVLRPERAARGPPGAPARREHPPGGRRPAAAGLQAQVRRLGREPRPAQGRRPAVRREGEGLAGLVPAPDVPRVPRPHLQPQGPGHPRLDAGAVLPPRGHQPRQPPDPERGVPPRDQVLVESTGAVPQSVGAAPSCTTILPPCVMNDSGSQDSARGSPFSVSDCTYWLASDVAGASTVSRTPLLRRSSTFGNSGLPTSSSARPGVCGNRPIAANTYQADRVPRSSFPGSPDGPVP